MTEFLQLCFAGLAVGCQYALVALGFVVVYAATRVINFALGALVAIGAYLTMTYTSSSLLSFYPAVVLAVGTTALIAAILQRLLLQRMVGKPPYAVLAITIGLLFVLQQVITTVWGFDAQNLGDPWGVRSVQVAGVTIAVRDLWTVGLTVAALAGFFVFFRHASLGVAMRATAEDPEAALAQGISARRVYAVAWALAGAVAALAGVAAASGPAGLRPAIDLIALTAFPAVILGGLDSPPGAVIGGVVMGLTQVLTSGYQPEHAPWLGSNFSSVMPYVVMVGILLVRPYGIFGTREVRRL